MIVLVCFDVSSHRMQRWSVMAEVSCGSFIVGSWLINVEPLLLCHVHHSRLNCQSYLHAQWWSHWKFACFNEIGLRAPCMDEVGNVGGRTCILWQVILPHNSQIGQTGMNLSSFMHTRRDLKRSIIIMLSFMEFWNTSFCSNVLMGFKSSFTSYFTIFSLNFKLCILCFFYKKKIKWTL